MAFRKGGVWFFCLTDRRWVAIRIGEGGLTTRVAYPGQSTRPRVVGSGILWVRVLPRGRSSIGRALPLQGRGCRFDPGRLHWRVSRLEFRVWNFRLGRVREWAGWRRVAQHNPGLGRSWIRDCAVGLRPNGKDPSSRAARSSNPRGNCQTD